MDAVGARKGKTGRAKKSESLSDISSTLPQVAAMLGVDERTARNHLKAAEDYQADAPELRDKVDAEALSAYREAMKHQGERVDLGNNVPEVERQDRGNARAYSLAVVQQECDKATVAMVRHCTLAAPDTNARC